MHIYFIHDRRVHTFYQLLNSVESFQSYQSNLFYVFMWTPFWWISSNAVVRCWHTPGVSEAKSFSKIANQVHEFCVNSLRRPLRVYVGSTAKLSHANGIANLISEIRLWTRSVIISGLDWQATAVYVIRSPRSQVLKNYLTADYVFRPEISLSGHVQSRSKAMTSLRCIVCVTRSLLLITTVRKIHVCSRVSLVQ